MSIPLFYGRTMPCDLYIWWQMEESAIVPPHSAQLSMFLFLSLKLSPSPVTLLLYTSVPCWTQMNPGVHTIALVLTRFFGSPPSLKCLPWLAVSFGTRWGCAPLFSHNPHRKKCCACPPTNEIRDVPPGVQIISVKLPLLLRPLHWRSSGRQGPPVSLLFLCIPDSRNTSWPLVPLSVNPSTSVLISVT